jgi:septum formation protein
MTQDAAVASGLVLASGSRHRAQLLANAGIAFRAVPAAVDERAIEEPLVRSGAGAPDIAQLLAVAKATQVSARFPDALVIGCDQTLEFQGRLVHKPASMEEARRRLLAFSGRSHSLHSAICLVRGGETRWSHVETAIIRFRTLAPGFVGRHLALAGDEVLSSVGAYQVEGLGAQLLAGIEGDYFSVVGLPLLPLLARLREMKCIDA